MSAVLGPDTIGHDGGGEREYKGRYFVFLTSPPRGGTAVSRETPARQHVTSLLDPGDNYDDQGPVNVTLR